MEASGSMLAVNLNYFCLLTRRTRFSRREEEEDKKKKKKKQKMVDYAGPAYDGLLAMISIQFDGCNDPEHSATSSWWMDLFRSNYRLRVCLAFCLEFCCCFVGLWLNYDALHVTSSSTSWASEVLGLVSHPGTQKLLIVTHFFTRRTPPTHDDFRLLRNDERLLRASQNVQDVMCSPWCTLSYR